MTREEAWENSKEEFIESLEKQRLTKEEMKRQIVGLEMGFYGITLPLQDITVCVYTHMELLSRMIGGEDLKEAVESCLTIIDRLQWILERITGEKEWTLWLQGDEIERAGFAGIHFGNGKFEEIKELPPERR